METTEQTSTASNPSQGSSALDRILVTTGDENGNIVEQTAKEYASEKPKVEEPKAEPKAETEPKEQAEDSKDRVPKSKKDFDRLTRKRRDAERERDALASQLRELREKYETTNRSPDSQQAQPQKMTRENFKTEEEWLDYRLDMREADRLEKQSKQAEVNSALEDWNDRMDELYDSDELRSVAEGHIRHVAPILDKYLSPDVANELATHRYAPKILEYMGSKRGFAEDFVKWHPVRQIQAIDKISSYLSAQKAPVAQVKTNAPPKARPKPIGEVPSGGASKQIDESSSLEDQVMAYRRKNRS
jgi:hypothetical protein